MSLFNELRRRNVFRVGIAYAVVAWLLMQIVDVVSPILGLPEWAPGLILLLLAVGFIPAVIFAWAYELTPEGLKRERDVPEGESISRATGRKLDFVIIGILAVAVAFLLLDRYSGGPGGSVEEVGDKTIAVLPFVNMSSDAEQEYFSDGITEEILNALASVKELRVSGRTSSFAFKGKNDDLRKIGKLLGVAHLLEGSVRKSGDTIRITAQLIRVDDGFHMWSEAYDRKLDDIFSIQDEISAEILNQMKAHLLEGEERAIIHDRTDLDVYDQFLLGRQYVYRRHPVLIGEAVDLLQQAIDGDPDYVPAYGLHAIALLLSSDRSYGTTPFESAMAQAKVSIDRAFELDDRHSESWAALGLYRSYLGETKASIEALERAVDINPNNVDAANWLASALMDIEDIGRARETFRSLLARDPLFRPAVGNGSGWLARFNSFARARQVVDTYEEFAGNDWLVRDSHADFDMLTGELAAAIDAYSELHDEASRDDTPARRDLARGLVLTMQPEAVIALRDPASSIDALDMLGRRDEAIAAGQRLAESNSFNGWFRLLNRAGRSQEVVDYFEANWADVDEYEAQRRLGRSAYSIMAPLAHAFLRAGATERFDEAMTRFEEFLRRYSDAGADYYSLSLQQAIFHTLAGDSEAALERLEHSIDQSIIGPVPLAIAYPEFESIRGEPRFVAAEARLAERINTERAKLNLPPISVDNDYWPQDR